LRAMALKGEQYWGRVSDHVEGLGEFD